MEKVVRVGGASGFWGDAAMATPQLLHAGELDYIVYDYLAEITMSIMARARAEKLEMGYATDFVSLALKPNLAEIARQKVKIIANAGGVNPQSCAAAVRALIAERGLALKVAAATGDDLLAQREELARTAPAEMFSGEAFPEANKILSINAYLGAFPIAKALDEGADIVITGRCVDSAVTLGALIHEFGWRATEWDKLAAGSLAGHILECGPQATGGHFTDRQAMTGTATPTVDVAIDRDGSGTGILVLRAARPSTPCPPASTGWTAWIVEWQGTVLDRLRSIELEPPPAASGITF